MKNKVGTFMMILASFAGLYILNAYLYNKLSWHNIAFQTDIGVVGDSIQDSSIGLTYQAKYDYAIDYLTSFLGDVELSDYVVVVDISEQKEYVFDKLGSFISSYGVSTGQEGTDREMTKSLWRVASKIGYEVAPLYGSRMMMLDRYVSGGWIETNVALHGTNEPDRIGTPFSLGCVYHNNADIIALFDILDIGTYVVAID